jgi:hypothetical protein
MHSEVLHNVYCSRNIITGDDDMCGAWNLYGEKRTARRFGAALGIPSLDGRTVLESSLDKEMRRETAFS